MTTFYAYGQNIVVPSLFDFDRFQRYLADHIGLRHPAVCQQLFEQYLQKGREGRGRGRQFRRQRPPPIQLLISDPTMVQRIASTPMSAIPAANLPVPKTTQLSARAAEFVPRFQKQDARERAASLPAAAPYWANAGPNVANETNVRFGLSAQRTWPIAATDATNGRGVIAATDATNGRGVIAAADATNGPGASPGHEVANSLKDNSREISPFGDATPRGLGNAGLTETRLAYRPISRWVRAGLPAFVNQDQIRRNFLLRQNETTRVYRPELVELLRDTTITTPSNGRFGAIGSKRAS